MSWIQQQTGPPLQQQQQYPPSTTTSISAVAAGVVGQNSTAKFVQQQWQPNQQPPQQQQQYLYNQQHLMQLNQQQTASNQNNWFNPQLNAVSNQLPPPQPQQQSPNNWQQQQLVPPLQQQSNSDYFLKQHSQNPQLDNFMSIETQAVQQQDSAHYQTVPTYANQSNISSNTQLISHNQPPILATGVTQNFITSEKMANLNNSQQQHFEIYDNHQQQQMQQTSQGIGNNNESWDDDWEWNESNQQAQQLIKNQQIQDQPTNFNANIIEESFTSEPNDNWQLNIEEPKVVPVQSSQPPPINKNLEAKNNELLNSLEGNINENRRQSLENPQNVNRRQSLENPQNLNQHATFDVNSQIALNSRNYQSLPIDTTVSNSENSQNINNNNNNVFVSQAKPVSQPSRQFASLPITSTSGSIDKVTSMPLPSTITNQNIISHPITSQSPGLSNVPPPPVQTPPQSGVPLPPPHLSNKNVGGNPFKRTGQPQHHRATGLIPSVQAPPIMPTQISESNTFFAPPPPEEFQNHQTSISPGNQEILSPENTEIISPEKQFENQEIAPSNDRNQYLQTSHLSEEDFPTVNNTATNISVVEQNNDSDHFPPPGLSRLVLGQLEVDNPANTNMGEIPPGLDRMIPGTELVSSSSLNLERQADGQDTIPSPRSAFTNVPSVELNDGSSNIDITGDRNLYLVPGESEHQVQQPQQQPQQPHAQRVVTGLENDTILSQQNSGEQRELELDGENLEDVQQPLIAHISFKQSDIDLSTRDEPIEGANISDLLPTVNQAQNNNSNSNETESSLTIETNPKDLSNASTANDESDNRNHFIKPTSRRAVGPDDKIKKRGNTNNKENIDKRKKRYDSEESDISIEHDRRRHHREGITRNDRGDKDNRDSKEKERREKRESNRGAEKDDRRRYGPEVRDDKERLAGRDSKRHERERRERGSEKYEKGGRDRRYGSRYENDSKYETETSRYERNRRDGSDRERDHYDEHRRDDKERRKHRKNGDGDRYSEERRDRRRGGERNERNDYREDRGDRHRNRSEKNRIGYDEDYRKSGSGSRNARDSDREKDRAARTDKESRYSQMYGGYPAGYNYDAYAYYQQHQQQYYEQLRRTNPQAYSEWYRKYFAGQTQSTDIGLTATDGRESVHSGRSSANNDKDRYSLHHQQQYIPHHASDYHRHFLQQSNISSTPNVSMNIEQHQQPAYHLDLNLNNGYNTLSSANFLQQHLHTGYSGYIGGSGISTTGRGHSYYAQSEYSESRPENLSLNLIGDGASSANQEPQRLTPYKFTNEHSTVSFSAGLLICVKPKYSQNGITNIVKILRLGSNDSTRRLFQTFPGPLIRGLTHKKTIIEFCEDQIRIGPTTTIHSRQNSMSSLSSTNQMNKASFTLMWNLLILLLRQNGMVVGTDIAELLMKNKNQFPYEFSISNTASATQSTSLRLGQTDTSNLNDIIGADSVAAFKEKITNFDENNGVNSINSENDDEDIDSSSKLLLTDQDITEKFRNYLLYGNVNEALDWATDNNLWGHALFLASKVDRRSHANVMMKFANKLQLNDPLQTLYQLMSGRTPSSVTSVQDEKWGDWRPHLSMILSNTSQRPDLDRKSITTLGDSLYNRGDLFGAQFCYLMAQVGFGKYSVVNPNETTFIPNSQNNAVRLILLGSSHHKNFREFATNEAIMMTEIYEYACSLNDDKFSIIEFQPYKFLLATRMLDYGYQLKTLMYMEQIALHVQRDPSKYEPTFIEKTYNLADRLKYYDPVLEKTMDDQNQNISAENSDANQQTFEDQKWLQDLRIILNEYKTDLYQENNKNIINYQSQISENGNTNNNNYDTNRATIDQQFVEINQQFSKLTMQYNNYDPMQQQLIQQEQQNENQSINLTQHGQINNTQQQQQVAQFYNPNDNNNMGQSQVSANDGLNYGDGSGGYSGNNYIQPQQQNQVYEQQHQQFNSLSDQPDSLTTGSGPSSQGNYEYWDHSQQSTQNESVMDKNVVIDNKNTSPPQISSEKNPIPRPTISLPNSNSGNKGGYYGGDDERDDKHEQNKQSGTATQQKPNKNGNKSGNNSLAQNSGWFGGIWNKLSLKPKNQMILPDDKNPAIVWDSEKKKWINTDGEVDEPESFKPPPKLGDMAPSIPSMQQPEISNYNTSVQQNPNLVQDPLLGQQTMYGQQQPQHIPLMSGQQPNQSQNINLNQQNYNPAMNNNGLAPTGLVNTPVVEPTKTPNLQSNMFKMQRNRTLKKSYVDVFNPSGAPSKPVEPVLAPTIPSSIPQGGFFIPAPISGDNQQQQQQEGGPQFYNPNQFGGGYQQ